MKTNNATVLPNAPSVVINKAHPHSPPTTTNGSNGSSVNVPEPFIKHKKVTLVTISLISGFSLDSGEWDIKVMYTDLAGKVHKVALKEATATFYKMYFCDVNSRYEAINKYNPSDIIFFCGRVLERLEVRREAY